MPVSTFSLKVIASDKVFFEGRCQSLVVPAHDGEKGILPHHEEMVMAVREGTVRIRLEDGAILYAGSFYWWIRRKGRRTLTASVRKKPRRERRSNCGKSRVFRNIIYPRRLSPGQLPV